MNASLPFRGQPLVTFVLVMGGWTIMRVLTWNAELFSPVLISEPAFVSKAVTAEKANKAAVAKSPVIHMETELGAARSVAVQRRLDTDALRATRDFPHPETEQGGTEASAPQTAGFAEPKSAGAPAADGVPVVVRFYPAGREPMRQRRWSADSWLLLRRGGKVSLGSGAAPATYGANQAGAVLRYRLAPRSRYQPAAYLRGTAALNGSDEKEAALGLSVRPIAALPVIAAAELRVTDQPGGARLRPAVFAVTQLPPFDLPLGLRGEAYAQAGYVGGAYSTAFADGQLRIDRLVVRPGQAGLRMGVGSWGGGQKGSNRLDVGPTVTLVTGLGGKGPGESASLRLEIDWRFRLAGNAAPDSGPAMTLSAGF